MLTVIGWIGLLAFLAVAVASGMQAVRFARTDSTDSKQHASWSASACAASICLAVCFAAVTGRIGPVAGAILGTVTALATLAVMWEDARQPIGEDGDSTRGLLKAAGDAAIAAAWAVGSVFHRDGTEDDEAGTPDELAPRRGRKDAELPVAASGELPQPAPVRAPKPRPMPPLEERTDPPVSTPPPAAPPTSGAGAAADVLTGVHVLCTHALSGGVQSVERVTMTLTEVAKGIGLALHTLGTRLSESDQHYGPEVWEKFLAMAAHLKGAAMTGTEASSTLHMVGSTPLREFGASGVTAPHHDKVNQV